MAGLKKKKLLSSTAFRLKRALRFMASHLPRDQWYDEGFLGWFTTVLMDCNSLTSNSFEKLSKMFFRKTKCACLIFLFFRKAKCACITTSKFWEKEISCGTLKKPLIIKNVK